VVIDERAVHNDSRRQSVSVETPSTRTGPGRLLEQATLRIVEELATRMARLTRVIGRTTLRVKIKFHDFSQTTEQAFGARRDLDSYTAC
jgi:DNA polymerase-4